MRVKLQKQFAYKHKDKEHFKDVVVIPERAVNELGWKRGQELELKVTNGRLILEAKSENKEKEEGC
jgi:formylmethanofuran dehydrogenase subunit D